MPRRLVRKQVLTAAACWLLGAALFAVAEPLWQAAGFFVFLLVPLTAVLIYWLVAERMRARRPAGFSVTADSFTNRPWRPIAAMFLTSGHLAGPKLIALLAASGPLDAVLSLFEAAMLSMLWVIGAVVAPRLVLSPAGLDCRGVGFPAASWDGIVDAELVVDGPRASRGVRLTLIGPYGRKRTETIPRGFDLDYPFLTAAIRHYIAHPEHRAAIGTDAELLRLISVTADQHDREVEVTGPGA
ncbi:hypothetical protein [Catellatospora sp. IY07-71]|uniref:hypothetical protein n=1 Tax=Catellatospora sp. IY07-71 TaxID=2728827 RepID=UPI001BB43186|nr:hypothetical protein [Catellatospora sp. IY07-71]